MKKMFMFGVALTVLPIGCVSTTVVRYPNANYAATNPDSVSVFSDFPLQSYDIIGESEATGAPAANWGSLKKGMKMKAAEIGGDAVVIIVQDTLFAGTVYKPGSVKGNTSTHGTSDGFLNANSSGGNLYGDYTGSANTSSTSNYTITPPTSTPIYKKHAKGFIIKFNQRILPSALTSAAKPKFVRDMNFPPVAVSKIDASVLSSASFLLYHDPTGQVHPTPLPPKTIQQQTDFEDQAKKWIIDELEKNGYTVEGGTFLFDSADTSRARFLFGGMIKDRKHDAYGHPAAHGFAKQEDKVEWQVYDKTVKAVIYKAEYVGVGSMDFSSGQQYSATVDAFRLFLGDPKLIETIQNSLKPTTSGTNASKNKI